MRATTFQVVRVGCCCLVALLWAVVLLARMFGTGPEDSAAACLHAIYRNPVTGREQGIGEARVAADGTMICRGSIHHAGSR